MTRKASAANVDAVLKDLAALIDLMWENKVVGVRASLKMGFLHWNSCFLISQHATTSSEAENAREALRKFDGFLVSPNPVGDGFEMWVIPRLWKNPYLKK